MEIIPVIDLKDGLVVHARRGERARYLPLVTPLAASAEPLAVIAGLMRLHAFSKLYVADLNAISGNAGHEDCIRRIGHTWPDLELWVDRGAATRSDVVTWREVLGSESQSDTSLVAAHRDDPSAILSLDFRGEDFQGPRELLEQHERWPQRVIVMTLARVGSDLGPDIARLETILRRAGRRQVFAAGGLRYLADGMALKNLGIAGVLVASALHDGRLTANDIRALA